MSISKQKGTKDIFGEDILIWQYVEKNIRKICNEYHIDEIRTPVFEATELYARGVGDDTDIVNKEMYTFLDKGNRSITLRPELTAGVVRAYIENGMASMPSPLKLWYIGNMYRYEKMQKGRYREFVQFGIEIFGSDSYIADIEAISVAKTLFKRLGLSDKIKLAINSIGCVECRAEYIKSLKEFLKPSLEKMCDTCKVRYEKNPLRILDCKESTCNRLLEDAPMITDYLCDECKSDFDGLKTMLDALNIEYTVDKRIVRGLDYYNKTVFEFIAKDLDLAVCAGGRYDHLVEHLDGAHTPAVGFGLGMDRLVLLLKEEKLVKDISNDLDLYFVILDKEAYPKCMNIVSKLRDFGYRVDFDIIGRSFKAQLKYADKMKAKHTCIVGKQELDNNECIFKDMNEGTQENLKLDVESIKEKLDIMK